MRNGLVSFINLGRGGGLWARCLEISLLLVLYSLIWLFLRYFFTIVLRNVLPSIGVSITDSGKFFGCRKIVSNNRSGLIP